MEDIRETMTEEEIEAHMRKEEDELNGYISKFAIANPPATTADDENEVEIFTLDTKDNKAYTVESSTFIAQPAPTVNVGGHIVGTLAPPEEPDYVPYATTVEAMINDKMGPDLFQDFHKLFVDTLTMKALNSLVSQIRAEQNKLAEATFGNVSGVVSGLVNDASLEVDKKILELRKAMRNGKVSYEDIPEWATNYIEDYIRNAVTEFALLTERN
ncbi:hypothetical protein_gp033 [Bacillus phage vB_BceM_WH1]|nr:hypothetical protein_gp033 [Bacillus phage vB_BceM_WH1]